MAPLRPLLIISLATALWGPSVAADTPQAAESRSPDAVTEGAPGLYQRLCAECHGPDRLGVTGPALLPENFGRLKPEEAAGRHPQGPPGEPDAGLRRQSDPRPIQALVESGLPAPAGDPDLGPGPDRGEPPGAGPDPATLPDKPLHGPTR